MKLKRSPAELMKGDEQKAKVNDFGFTIMNSIEYVFKNSTTEFNAQLGLPENS